VLPNSLFQRATSVYSGSCVAFVAITEHGVQQLGETHRSEAGRRLPAGWTEVADPESGRPYYAGPRNETTWTPPLTSAAIAARALFSEHGIASVPTTQIWKDGELLRQLGSVELESALSKLVADDNLYDKPPGVAGDCA
jgi:hypothetical protein